jgi:CheY-like chemotaxis protein/HAMP domain-containing protein
MSTEASTPSSHSNLIDGRQILAALRAIRQGDFNARLPLDQIGMSGEVYQAFNDVVELLATSTAEIDRVSQVVGKEGKITHRASVPGAAGGWAVRIEAINNLITDLVRPTAEVARVIGGVARGDLSQRMELELEGRPLEGEFLRLGKTVNTMVDQLNSFASEVTRVAREVGTEGKLGGQAVVKGVEGTWKDLTDNVNLMAANLTGQVRNIAEVSTAIANGDLSKKITVDVRGEFLQLKDAINTMVDQLRSFASEVTRVAREVGTEGKLGGQAVVPGVAGVWKDLTDNVNYMASNLTGQVRNIAQVTTAVAKGDLTQKITVDAKGEILELKNTINVMVDQLNSFASEVTRVAREVGTEGKLGGQAVVKGVAGTWKDLTDSVNFMAGNLTDQVRGIAKVVTAVANGNLKSKLIFQAKGEIAALADTINGMIDTLATFADQVTTVAREVGVEGKLGGQAEVPGAAGTWRDLTDNVNELAANMSTQVRAIAEVATAVTKGDLTRSIRAEARGELSELKDNINQMIGNLRDTTQKNNEQDWLKTNLAKFTRLLQGQRDLMAVAKLILSELAPLVKAQHGVFYLMEGEGDNAELRLLSSYAYKERKGLSNRFRMGEAIVGQCAMEKERILVTDVPNDYIHINSGLGSAAPGNLVVIPVVFENQVKAVIELASFNRFTDIHLTFLDQLMESIGIVLNTISAGMRTEQLLKQSQSLATELTSQQQELRETNTRLERQAATLRESEELLKRQQEKLQQTNEELEEKAHLLATQKSEVEAKNHQIELARTALQDKAEQLAVTSKYKSEFLANMSHELRTPLNSLLILSKLLLDNPDGNLTPKQTEHIKTVYAAGSDLLTLINDVLDMAKIESGTTPMEVGEVPVTELTEYVERSFREVAQSKGLAFNVTVDPEAPATVHTDGKRIQQVLKNLLSNAFKFTEKGRVDLRVAPVARGWSVDNNVLNRAGRVLAFSVTDTGIGIAADKQKIIFEAFQQADTGTARKYGGTGLGLSISREITRLLGGEIRVVSALGRGSTFTLYLPQSYQAADGAGARAEFAAAAAGAGERRGVSGERRGVSPTWPAPAPAPEHGGLTPRRSPAPVAIADDRAAIQPGDRVLLVVEDDPNFIHTMLTLARDNGFRVIVATRGEDALGLAKDYKPDAITLDIQLPDIDGWTVLDRLKHDPETLHIPVHVLSVNDRAQRGKKMGALAWLTKPVSKEALEGVFTRLQTFVNRSVEQLLVVEDNDLERNSIASLIADRDVEVTQAATATVALERLNAQRFYCVVLDLCLPDMPGIDFLARLRQHPDCKEVPVIIYTGKQLSAEEEAELRQLSEAIIVKGEQSPNRLLAETALFLHRIEAHLPDTKKRILRQAQSEDSQLTGKKVLIVDDDVRNIFALTAVLETQHMQVLYAEDGRAALDLLQQHPDVDVVLMDIMMPDMDGYETTRRLRRLEPFRDLPVIALTAKAMKGDREKCLEAGASDYIAKPVDPQQLVSLLRVWLYR